CREADVPVAAARSLALALGRDRPATVLVGWGMTRRANGATIVRALDALGAITGNVGVPGAGVSFYHQRRAAFRSPEPAGPPPRRIPEPLFGRAVLQATDPPIRAIWITAGNPVASLPDSTSVAAALDQTELVVVVDSFLTDTAEHADVVLPTTTLLEDDDLLGAYGHPYLAASTPALPPPPTVRSDLRILVDLAERMGLDSVIDGDPRAWKQRMIAGLQPDEITLEQLEAGTVRRPGAPRIVFEGRRFETHSGRVQLMTTLDAPPATAPPSDRPLWLISVSVAEAQCTQWIEVPQGPIPVTIHPDAPGALPDGTIARLSSAVGAIEVRLVHDRRQRTDVALIPKGGHVRRGQAANLLIGARLTDLGTGGDLHGEAVRIEPLG
ncbi:MAG TPA: molybdopterin-containing oxidoreductase catalytic subunit, partial [Deltaproteobacteria bacterium]|nr:molybdopterin-containing oxidoreductase catalytic subunit [Deltaproteobacteria bacterium]